MCTVTWIVERDRIDIFFNRDERLSRKVAEPPKLELCREGRVMAPRDGDHGGTWMGVNHRGLAACILNYYGIEFTPAEPIRSRGLLVTDVLCRDNLEDARNYLQQLEIHVYRPFTLLVFQPGSQPIKGVWDAESLRISGLDDSEMPVSSSAFNTAEVCRLRRREWIDSGESNIPAMDRHLNFHASHIPEKGPCSVCMHRHDAQTVSFSHLTINSSRAVFRYAGGAPCTRPDQHTMSLEIVPAGLNFGS